MDIEKNKMTNEEIEQNRQEHIKLYQGVYARDVDDNGMSLENYGATNHGSSLASVLAKQDPKSIADIGCGKLQFLLQMKNLCEEGILIGIDPYFECDCSNNSLRHVLKAYKGIAQNLPLETDSVEWLTCFDVLEHIPEFDMGTVFKEFQRVATKGLLMSISTRDSVLRINGKSLHATVKSRVWWMEKIFCEWLTGDSIETFLLEDKETYFNIGIYL